MELFLTILIYCLNIGNKKIIGLLANKYKTRIVFEIPFSKDIINSYSKGEPITIPKILSVIK